MKIKRTARYWVERFKYEVFLLFNKTKRIFIPEKKTCEKDGHSASFVYEWRLRKRGGSNNWSRKGGKRRPDYRYVLGGYYVCDRCGKKLSNFERI